jgi:hypothetical protein
MGEEERTKKLRDAMRDVNARLAASSRYQSNTSVIPFEVHAQLQLQDFLKHHFEGFLLEDLKTMATVIPKDRHPGGVGYPMVQTVCAGIEFLGMLLRPGADKFTPGDDIRYFGHYWKHYLSAHNPKYKPYAPIARELVRNGLAHFFLTKKKIGVNRDRPDLHLEMVEGVLIINCIRFYEDLRDSYFNNAKPVLLGKQDGLRLAHHRLNSMLALYSQQSDDEFSKIKLPNNVIRPPHSTTTSGTLYQ